VVAVRGYRGKRHCLKEMGLAEVAMFVRPVVGWKREAMVHQLEVAENYYPPKYQREAEDRPSGLEEVEAGRKGDNEWLESA